MTFWTLNAIKIEYNIDIWESEQICACRYIDYLVDIAYMIEHTDEERSERMNKYF